MLAKLAVYLTLGVALLACNVWFFSSAYRALTGGDFVVAPVKVIGGTGDADAAGEALAGMIISSYQKLRWDLRQSQSATADARPGAAIPTGIATGVIPTAGVLDAHIFEPVKLDVKVAGVDVGGFLPRIQRWFVADRTMAFSVSWKDNKDAVVAGYISALGGDEAKPIWLVVHNATTDSIAEAVALAIVQPQLAKGIPQLAELRAEEFSQLVHSFNDVAQIKRRAAAYGAQVNDASAKEEYAKVLASIDPLTKRLGGWSDLTCFVADIAEKAEQYDRALELYGLLRTAQKPPLAADVLAAKIAALETLRGETKGTALQKMQDYAADAARILNRLFDAKLPDPQVELEGDNFLNAYWDGQKIKAPSIVRTMPDIVYHEAAWPFVQSRWRTFKYQGQTGALVQSYTDVLAALVKQTLLKQDATTADWVIAPGAIAWLTGRPNDIASDRRPLRSLKEPGKAYDDDKLGKDPQIANLADLPKAHLDDDNGGVHVLSGIPSLAFYETAKRIGTDKAGRIWIASLDQFNETTDFAKASGLIHKKAMTLYGDNSDEAKAVKAAWSAVGLSL